MTSPRGRPLVRLALVHHANQYLITDGYDNRQGITPIVEGYAAALRLHERYRIPANLHLSGTLIETIAWHCPWFFELVRELRVRGLLALIGGSYSEPPMTLFSPDFNRQQLNESLWLYRRHLGCAPEDVTVFWVPERIWDTARLAPVLTSPRLANGGYRTVLLDDRLLFPLNGTYAGSPRGHFDAAGPYDPGLKARAGIAPAWSPNGQAVFRNRIYRIAGGQGLHMVPISAELRYCVPPSSDEHWRQLETMMSTADASPNAVLVYGDDLEKTAGVGGWDSAALGRYEGFLQWLASRADVSPVLLPAWLADRPQATTREIQAGAFFELGRGWGAGEDYRGWAEHPAWYRYRTYIADAERAVQQAQQEPVDRRLVTLARKHMLAATYETAWHDNVEAAYQPAPWARAVASHARSSLVLLAAARWFGRARRPPMVTVGDIDQDGEDEVVLCNEQLYAVFAPNHGGRLIYLFAPTSRGGVLLVGNPTDDWNFQVPLNRFMDCPPNHPAALADVGFVHDRYRVATQASATRAVIDLVNTEPSSAAGGLRKRIVLAEGIPALFICYRVPDRTAPLTTEICLSPDYLDLLREGRQGLTTCGGRSWQGWRNRGVTAWVAVAPEEDTRWVMPDRAEVGHGMVLGVRAAAAHFHLLIGCGPVSRRSCRRLLDAGMSMSEPGTELAPCTLTDVGHGVQTV